MRAFLTLLLASISTWCMGQMFLPHRHSVSFSSSAPLPLDNLTNPPFYALSVTRKLWSGWTGMCFQASTLTATQSIGFVNGLADTNTLLTFANGGSAWITAIYDQSGNTQHLTLVPVTITNRFIIVTNGTLIVDANGHPMAHSNPAVTTFIQRDNTPPVLATSGTNVTYYYIFQARTHVNNSQLVCASSTEGLSLFQQSAANLSMHSLGVTLAGPSYSLNTQHLATAQWVNGTSTGFIRLDNGSKTSGPTGTTTGTDICVGYQSGNITADEYFSELYVWELNTHLAGPSEDSSMTNNINSFYHIW